MESLCRACGLCCDGSLFDFVPLEPSDRKRLPLAPNGRGFEQPCPAFTGDCAIYDDRPEPCRRFECKLHASFRRDGGPIAPRLEKVRRLRALLAAGEATDELARLFEDDFARA